MEQALSFIRLRIGQIGMDLQVYKELGPSYADEQVRLIAVLGELENLIMALETFTAVNTASYQTDNHG